MLIIYQNIDARPWVSSLKCAMIWTGTIALVAAGHKHRWKRVELQRGLSPTAGGEKKVKGI